ncbi:MAG TPA: pyrroline-5-carboxylate reductase [Chroococcidiopsis sp.]
MVIKLGIIGGGVMAEALLSRLVQRSVYAPEQVWVSEPSAPRRDELMRLYGVQTTADNQAVTAAAELLLLAIKPQVFDAVVAGLTPTLPSQLVVSILAGVPIAKLEAPFPGQPVIRAMPNTPAIAGAGITAIAPGQQVQPEHIALARTLFEAVGDVVEIPEHLMDAVTGLSGSGPGYIALVVEALTDGGVAVGLPRAIASKLAVQTVLGTGELLHSTGLHPAELKDRVTSPGGTTIAGIAHLEQAGIRSAFIEAVRAAYLRAGELGR